MYPHVMQFETRNLQFELEDELSRERKQARKGTMACGPSLLARIGSALAERGLRNPTATSPR